MEQRLVDITLGIKSRSTSVLHLLSDYLMKDFGKDDGLHIANDKGQHIDTKTYPWYNGRECGYVVEFKVGKNVYTCKTFFIAFAECRGSDSIAIETWEDEQSLNPVCTSELRGKRLGGGAANRLYAERRVCKTVDEAVTAIVGLMKKHNQKCMLLQDVTDVIET